MVRDGRYDVDHDGRDVVAGFARQRQLDEASGRCVRIDDTGENPANRPAGQLVGESVGAQQQTAAPRRQQRDLGEGELLDADRASDHIRHRVGGGLGDAAPPRPDELVDQRVVGGHQLELAVGEPVAPRIADVGDRDRRLAVVGGGDRRQHDGGAHAVGVVEHGAPQDLAVGDLDRPVERRLLDDRGARQVAGDLCGGDGAGNAAGDVAAHPVGDDAEPLGDDVAVLVGGCAGCRSTLPRRLRT